MAVRLVASNDAAGIKRSDLLTVSRHMRIAISNLGMALDALGHDVGPQRMKVRFKIADSANELALVLEALGQAILAEAEPRDPPAA